MKKKRKDRDFEEEQEREFDPDLLKHFVTESVDLKDQYRVDGNTEVIDLHFEKIETKGQRFSQDEKIRLQLSKFEKSLDSAIGSGKKKLIAIHGKGTGKLREEVISILKDHPMVKSWNAKSKGNHGALEIIL